VENYCRKIGDILIKPPPEKKFPVLMLLERGILKLI